MTLLRGARGALFALSVAGCVFGQSFDTFTVLDAEPHGINNANQIVGAKEASAFIRQPNGAVTLFVYPGAARTIAYGINNAGQIVGAYVDLAGNYHGFLRSATGFFTPIDVPGATNTIPYGINDSGVVAGSVDGLSGSGFIRSASGVITVFSDALRAVNNAGKSIGTRVISRQEQLFVLDAAGNVTLDPEGKAAARESIVAWALNNNDVIGGEYKAIAPQAQTATAGFTKRVGEVLSPIHVYFPTSTLAFQNDAVLGLNDAGIVTGRFGNTSRGGYFASLPCGVSVNLSSQALSADAATVNVQVTAASNCGWIAKSDASWATVLSGVGSGTATVQVGANNQTRSARVAHITIGGQSITITQDGGTCTASSYGFGAAKPANGGVASARIQIPTGCPWTAVSDSSWLSITGGGSASGSSDLSVMVAQNASTSSRTGHINVGSLSLSISQQAAAGTCPTRIGLNTASAMEIPAAGGNYALPVTAPAGCSWTATAMNLTLTNATGTGNGVIRFSMPQSTAASANTSYLWLGTETVSVVQQGTNSTDLFLRFVPIAPCRAVDTRPMQPIPAGASTRTFTLATSGCGIPADAQAVSLNVTAIPATTLSFLTIWPSDQTQPVVSTLNAPNGGVVANAAIVGVGPNAGVSVYVTDQSDVLLDVNGYFTSAFSDQALAFYPTPACRVLDTRSSGPALTAAAPTRSVSLVSSACGVPANARAYSLNATVVPNGPLSFLTLWPADQPRPLVSTLNSGEGRILANAAVVPAAADGSISMFAALPAGGRTDVVLDINGYFAPAGEPGAQFFRPVTPRRIYDTRTSSDVLAGGMSTRVIWPGLNNTAGALAANVTVVPHGPLAYLSVWPADQTQPAVSTLNSADGRVVSNAALIALSDTSGYFDLATLADLAATVDVIVDVSGYFLP